MGMFLLPLLCLLFPECAPELRVWGLTTYIRLKQAAGLVFTPSVTHLPERTTNCCCCPLQALSSDSFSAEVCFTTSFITCRPSSDAVVWCFRVNNTSYLCWTWSCFLTFSPFPCSGFSKEEIGQRHNTLSSCTRSLEYALNHRFPIFGRTSAYEFSMAL